jgi:SRSO17 transposase
VSACARRFENFAAVIASLFKVQGHDLGSHARSYLSSLLSRVPRKNLERFAEEFGDIDYQNLQQFISDSPWQCGPVWKWIADEAGRLLAGPGPRMLLIDESAFPKKGHRSAGVARQYCGRLGKTENCQVGVFSALCRDGQAQLTGARLYLPKDWTEDDERCEQAGIPEEDRAFATKNELAWELIREAEANGLEFDWVGADSAYGRDQDLMLRIAGMGKKFVMDVETDQMVWTDEPEGSKRPTAVGKSGARTVASIWEDKKTKAARIDLRKAENGTVSVDFWATRVWIWPKACEIPLEVWLLASRRANGEMKYSLSNAPEETRFVELAMRQGQRYFVERVFEDAKSELGMGEYQVRKWRAWHHHMALVGMAMAFAFGERLRLEPGNPLISTRDVVDMVAWYFQEERSAADVEAGIRARHRRRKQAMECKIRREASQSSILTM